MPMIAHFLQRALAVYPLLQAAQGLLDRLAFLKSYFRQSSFTSSLKPPAVLTVRNAAAGLESGREH